MFDRRDISPDKTPQLSPINFMKQPDIMSRPEEPDFISNNLSSAFKQGDIFNSIHKETTKP